ncbi:hypothetical protein BJY21_002454 [Kineosphaera limosa]|uniref:DinB-like domain-containing protein n=1 Tax=Kineosphaera limosa NBRC 100340 TaxID=1184609 RepID=K6WV11_9MICO|nr:DUF664 domain-containing protein [Kineosphaera limosa]NYE01270.1 hypothetical protein [Kineosphaera limosa]GAB95932.1 hypothetical protein KILIM_029_00420 [Kineosphaera limosa NBRC 100340]
MSTAAAFIDLFDRMPDLVRESLDSLDESQLTQRIAPQANTIAWLIWHLARVEDDHISGAAAALALPEYTDQAYLRLSFVDRFDLPFAPRETGYGMTTEQVGQVRAPGDLLVAYYDAVHAKTDAMLRHVREDDWSTIVDEQWTPPVTLQARIVSVANDVTQHVGQAAFVRGILLAH